MFCKNCGQKIETDAKFCKQCGVSILEEFNNPITDQNNSTRKIINGYVALKNPHTNEIRNIKNGFSWTCFLFFEFGIPLFLRGLIGTGILGLIFLIIAMLCLAAPPEVSALFFFISLIPSVYVGVTSNSKAEQILLRNGWVYR